MGFGAGYNASQKTDAVNSMALGNGAYNTLDNQVVIGNTSVTQTLLNGNVGIGTTNPNRKLQVIGAASCSDTLRCGNQTVYSYIKPGDLTFTVSSTKEIKQNIRDIATPDSILNKISAVNPKIYNFKPSIFRNTFKLSDIPDSVKVDSFRRSHR